MASDIKFRLGLDGKDFDRGLDNAKKKASGFASQMESIGKKASETFGAKNIFQGLLQGLGIGSAEKIVERITAGFKAAAEHAKDLADSTEKSLRSLQRLITGRRTDEQNLAALQRDQARDSRSVVTGKNRLAFSMEKDPALQKQIADTTAQMAERAVEIDELQRKIDKEAKQRIKDLTDAQAKLADAKQATARAGMTDAQLLVDLDMQRAKYGLESLNSKTTELERTKAATKEAETQREIAALRKKISEDEAKIAEKAAADQKKRREEAEKLNKELEKARKKETEARGELRNARGEQFAFTLAEAAQGTRGSRGGGRAAKLIEQKTGIMGQILDRGDYQVAFGDDGAPTLTSRDPGKARDARQATGRFRQLYSDREALRGSINNLSAADKDPFASQKKAYKEALDESKTLKAMEKSLEGKFKVQE